MWGFSCTYDLNTNTFNISSKFSDATVDARNSWSLSTDTTMNTLTRWTSPVPDKIIYIALMLIFKLIQPIR